MTKYLNAEEMLNNYEADCEVYENHGDSLDAELWMVYYLKNHSSADVQPVVHAFWRKFKDDKYDLRMMCSNCGYVHVYMKNKKYCPMCGAKMDGDENDNG